MGLGVPLSIAMFKVRVVVMFVGGAGWGAQKQMTDAIAVF